MSRRLVIALFLVALILALALSVGEVSDVATLRVQVVRLEAWRAESPVLFAILYLLAYVVVAALSLPFAVPMTLIGGAAFGVVLGTMLVALGATFGALAAFLVARYLLADAVNRRFGDRMGPINAGIERDGWTYLFTLRLIPVFPFFLINLVMALTPISAWRFFWASLFGMLPATFIYVNAGTQLAAIRSLSDILSPGLIVSLLAIAALPWAARFVIARFKGEPMPGNHRKPDRFDRNLIVIGAGAAGLTAAAVAAGSGAKVSLIEKGEMGGDCLNTGCVPSKALIHGAKLARSVRGEPANGVTGSVPAIDFSAIMAHVNHARAAIAPHDSVERFTGLGVDVIAGTARLADPWTVEIERQDGAMQRLTSRAIVLATGARPIIPPIPGIETVRVLTSDTIWDHLNALTAVPDRMVVVGGGPIGCELAQAMARLGSKVTIVEAGPRLLPREDADAAAVVVASLAEDGITMLTSTSAVAARREGDKDVLVVSHDNTQTGLPCDVLLFAIGRKAVFSGLGLEAIGLDPVSADATLSTRFPHIMLAGDAAGQGQLTNLAGHHGWHAAINGLFGFLHKLKVDDSVIPRAVYTDPELARVGLSEDEANKAGVPVDCILQPLASLDRGVTDGITSGFLKVLLAKGSDRIVGVTIVGPGAGELIAFWALAMKNKLGLSAVQKTVMAYPTLAESGKIAAGTWRKQKLSPRLIGWLTWINKRRRG